MTNDRRFPSSGGSGGCLGYGTSGSTLGRRPARVVRNRGSVTQRSAGQEEEEGKNLSTGAAGTPFQLQPLGMLFPCRAV